MAKGDNTRRLLSIMLAIPGLDLDGRGGQRQR
jgi:hypothetical protein